MLTCSIPVRAQSVNLSPDAPEAPAVAAPRPHPAKRVAHPVKREKKVENTGPAAPIAPPPPVPPPAASAVPPATPMPPASGLAPSPAPAPGVASPTAVGPAANDVAAQLRQNGAGACSGRVNEMASGVMAGVTTFRTAASWATAAQDKHAVSVLIGQKFGASAGVPYGATSVIAAPGPGGVCDAFAVQVIPSPMPCDKLGQIILTRGKVLGDLAGVALLQDGAGQTMLVPTGANSCVLVGMRASYANKE